MKIAFFEIEGWEKEYLKKTLKNHDLSFFKEPLTFENANKVKDSEIISVFVYSEINEKTLSKLKELKGMATRSTGFDHIDLKSCRNRNVKVMNVPHYGENTVAEHAFALILALAKHIFSSCERTKKCNFSLEGIRGFDLKGKTIGIIGVGHIGSHVAKIAHGFEMKIMAFSRSQDKNLIKKYGVKYTSLNNLLKNSNIITLHLPLTKQTKHILNKNNFSFIKKGAYIINTARGALLDTTELIKALNKKQIAGAGLDVLEEEDIIKDRNPLTTRPLKEEQLKNLLENHELLNYKNVIITPHNAFNTLGALQRILETTAVNIKSFTKDKPINIVS